MQTRKWFPVVVMRTVLEAGWQRRGGCECAISRSAQRSLGSTAALNAKVYEIAASLGLFVRVGHPVDFVYLAVYR